MARCNTCRYKDKACSEQTRAENKDKDNPKCYKPLLIPLREWEGISDDYKDISEDGERRTWLTMIDGETCLLIEGEHFEIR